MESPKDYTKEKTKKFDLMKVDINKDLMWNFDKLESIHKEIIKRTNKYKRLEKQVDKLEKYQNGEDTELWKKLKKKISEIDMNWNLYEEYDYDSPEEVLIDELYLDLENVEDDVEYDILQKLDKFEHLDFGMAKILMEFPGISWKNYYIKHYNKFWDVNSENIEERKILLKTVIDQNCFLQQIDEKKFFKAFKWCLDDEIALYILNKNNAIIECLKDWIIEDFNNRFMNQSDLKFFLDHMDKFRWLNRKVFNILFDIFDMCGNGKNEDVCITMATYILKNIDKFDCFSDDEKKEFKEKYKLTQKEFN